MNKKNKIDYLLHLIKEKTEELMEVEELVLMNPTAEELVLVAAEEILKSSISIKYSNPIAQVDRSQIQFLLDEENNVILNFEDE